MQYTGVAFGRMKLHVPVLLPVSKMVEVLLWLVLIMYMEIILYDAVSFTVLLVWSASQAGHLCMLGASRALALCTGGLLI